MSSHRRAISLDPKPRKTQLRRTQSLDFNTTENLTTSSTPRPFRRHSETKTNPMPVDMDTSRSYRLGSPGLIAPPFSTQPAGKIPRWDISAILRLVMPVLEQAHVHVCTCSVIRQFRPENSTSTPPPILFIESDLSLDGQYACWKAGFEELRRLLDSLELEEMLIDIIDKRATQPVSARPILECTPEMFRGWQSFVSLLLEEIKEKDWLAVDTIRREFGLKVPLTIPTVVITTKDADNEIWRRHIVPRLRSFLPPGWDIDVFYACALSYTSGEEKIAQDTNNLAIYSTIADYAPMVEMGSSIGLDEPANSATLGGAVTLRDRSGNETICGLTNHHVVAKAPGLVSENCAVGQFLSPDHPICRDGQVRVIAPSHHDHEQFCEYTNRRRDKYRNWLFKLENEHMQDSRAYPRVVEDLEKANAEWDVLDKKPDKFLGTVWATSGYRLCDNASYSKAEKLSFSNVSEPKSCTDWTSLKATTNGRVLDFGLNWALIKITPERELNELIPLVPFNYGLLSYSHAAQFTRIHPNQSYTVAKKGRTTGWTRGTISRIGSILKLRSEDDKTNTVPADLTNRFGDSNVILAFGVFHQDATRDFMKGGDSGSYVLLAEDSLRVTVVGMLFASNEQTRVSYMMPMDMVIQDIEHVTGQTVIHPTFVEYADRHKRDSHYYV